MNQVLRDCLLVIGLMLLTLVATGEKERPGSLIVEKAWARATPPGAPMGAVYLQIINPTKITVEVVEITTPVAEVSEVHESVETNGMARMREVDPFIIPADSTVRLEPGGKHIMLVRLKEPLKKGGKFLLTLATRDGSVQAEVVVGGFGQMSMPN